MNARITDKALCAESPSAAPTPFARTAHRATRGTGARTGFDDRAHPDDEDRRREGNETDDACSEDARLFEEAMCATGETPQGGALDAASPNRDSPDRGATNKGALNTGAPDSGSANERSLRAASPGTSPQSAPEPGASSPHSAAYSPSASPQATSPHPASAHAGSPHPAARGQRTEDGAADTPEHGGDVSLASLFAGRFDNAAPAVPVPTDAAPRADSLDRAAELAEHLAERILVSETSASGQEVRILPSRDILPDTEICLVRGPDGLLSAVIRTDNPATFQTLAAAQHDLRQRLEKSEGKAVHVDLRSSADDDDPRRRSRGLDMYPHI